MSKTKPSVFIIESLRFKDERSGHMEGQILQQILHLSGKEAEYVYIRTAKELEEVLDQYYESNFRYLHISCHGNDREIALTLDTLDFPKFGELVDPILKNRRLFVSACSVVNKAFAAAVIPGSECQSIVGPGKDILFGDAAMMWAAFYHLVFKTNADAMNLQAIRSALEKTRTAFGIPFKYFAKSESSPAGYKEHSIGV